MLTSGNNDAIKDAKLLKEKNFISGHGMTAPLLFMKCIYKNKCNITMAIFLVRMRGNTLIRYIQFYDHFIEAVSS